jgi:hypothetical protein
MAAMGLAPCRPPSASVWALNGVGDGAIAFFGLMQTEATAAEWIFSQEKSIPAALIGATLIRKML